MSEGAWSAKRGHGGRVGSKQSHIATSHSTPYGIIELSSKGLAQADTQQRSNTMKQVTNYLSAVEQHIEGSFNLGDAMQKFAPVFNSMKIAQQLEVRSNIARIISIKKRVPTIEITKGSYTGSLGFESKKNGGNDASECARAMLKYYMPSQVEKTSTKPKAVKKPDAVAKLVTQFKALTPAQRKAFLAKI